MGFVKTWPLSTACGNKKQFVVNGADIRYMLGESMRLDNCFDRAHLWVLSHY
jgi:hypothetical protein